MKILKNPKFEPFYCLACHCEFEIEPGIDTVNCCAYAGNHENDPDYWMFQSTCPICGKDCFSYIVEEKKNQL